MSLFKIREFWTTQSEDDEYFDQNSLITTTLNSDSDFIISGSQSGVLRIFKPSSELTENDGIIGYSATDLLIEKILNVPILQIGCGRLVSGSQNLQIAVLHPRLLSIYTLKSKEGATEHGTQHYLELLYEHSLRRSSANFVIGQFGGSQNRDFICVQSLDGMLSFFEQESFTFSCFVPDFLLPGPIAYVKKTDHFVTSSSSWCIVAYKYKLLSEAGEKSEEKVNSSVKIDCDWSFNLGEAVIDIYVIDDFINKEAWIMLLGERNLYCLKYNGKLKFMKRLDYSPICFHTYVLGDNIISLIISETNTLLIYENTTLTWSAQLQFLPVSMRRAFLRTIKGALVLLSEEGRLECCYLGTEPSLFVAPPLTTKEIDFERAEDELINLNKIIKKSYGNDMKISNSNTEKELGINLLVNPDLKLSTFESNLKDIENQQMCVISIEILPQIPFEEVQISVAVLRPLKASPQVKFYNNLNEKTSFTCYVFLDAAFEIPSLSMEVSATVITNLGLPKTICKSTMLPMKLVLDSCQAQKESQHKITLNINHSPVSLATLFPEYVGEDSLSQSGNPIGFKSVTGNVATILLAKSSERYRLQSDSFASLNILIEQMIFRLEKHYSNKSDFNVSYSASLPANEFILYVNNHFSKRQQVIQLQDDLSQLGAQFRIIQKRLIAKFKVKNPMPLTNLEILLQDTYTEINNTTEKLQQVNSETAKAQTELSCALNLVRNLIKHMDIDKNLKELLESTFSINVYDLESQNWEDVMNVSLCYLLRTALAKSEKDRLRAVHTSFEDVKDITKLEKHISQVLERIPKKGKELSTEPSPEEENQQEHQETSPELEKNRSGVNLGNPVHVYFQPGRVY